MLPFSLRFVKAYCSEQVVQILVAWRQNQNESHIALLRQHLSASYQNGFTTATYYIMSVSWIAKRHYRVDISISVKGMLVTMCGYYGNPTEKQGDIFA